MESKLVIHTPDKLDQEIEEFKLDSFDEGKNLTSARIKLTRDLETEEPVLWYSQELVRNFRDPTDAYATRHILKPYTSSNIEAAADETLSNKYQDTVLGYKKIVPDYAPLTDIRSDSMKLYVDEHSAQFLSDVGVNVEGLGEDFTEMESVSATGFMEDISKDATKIKEELTFVESMMKGLKDKIAHEFEEYVDPEKLSDEEFTLRMSNENIPEHFVQRYLQLCEQLKELNNKLGLVNREVYQETSRLIKLPTQLQEKNNGFY